MIYVYLGNSRAMHHPGGEPTPLEGDQITEFHEHETNTLDEQVRNITHEEEGAWIVHSRARRPDWVECTDPELEQALADYYGCPIGRPEVTE